MEKEESPLEPNVLARFGEELEVLLRNTVAEKSKEIEAREALVAEREAKTNRFLAAQHSADKVVLRVGQETFYTTRSTLLREPESYFHGMLSEDFKREEDGSFFVDRDATSFRYVLEYLVYGDLLSNVNDPAVLRKLEIDADFYCLPPLLEQVRQRQQGGRSCGNLAVWRSDRNASQGTFQAWTVEDIPPDAKLYQRSGDDTKVTVQREGAFLVEAQLTSGPSNGNYYVALCKNSAEISCSYGTARHESSSYSFTYTVSAMLRLAAGDEISVRNCTGSQTNNNPKTNFLRLSLFQ